MKISQAGIDAIKRHEGLRLHAYLDSADVPTIGYGHTADVEMGQHISEWRAEEFLRADLMWAEMAVNNAVRVPVSQAQYDALVSLCFNIGVTAFKNSTLVEKLNAGDTANSCDGTRPPSTAPSR
jgi:lysozyme